MRKLKVISFLSILLLSFSSKAQLRRLSETPEIFITDIQAVMATDNNAVAIATGKKFETYWTSRFSNEQKTALIATCRKMSIRGHKMAQFYFFFTILDKAIEQEKFSDEKVSNLITITDKFVEDYGLKTSTKMFEVLKDFLEKRRLYISNFNRLYALGGSYELKFLDKKTDTNAPVTSQNTATQDVPVQLEEKKYFDDWDTPPVSETIISSAGGVSSQSLFEGKKTMPLIGGLSIQLDNVDLIMATSSDSVWIKKTSGTVSLKDGIYVGKDGLFTFESAKLPQISVVLTNFAFEIRTPKFTAEDVTLTYTDRLTAPIKGVFEYKSEKRNKGILPTYPRFMSYQSDAFIKNIDQNIEYRGGFSISGKRIFSSSVQNRYSNISVKKDGKVVFKASSTRFELGDSLITSQLANFVAFIENDSIYHPAIKFNYNQKKYILRLNKIDAGGFKETVFTDTYHQMNIKCDAMRWNLNESKMEFYIVSAKNQVPAIFESFDFYDVQRVSALNSSAGFNPLLMVGNFTQKNNKLNFTLDEIASYNKVPAQNIRGDLMVAVQQGFVNYNPSADVFKITSKGQHYLAAFAGKRDFDDFLIPSIYGNSNDSTSNATLNLKDKVLTIRGIRRFNLSDSLRIYVLPYDQTIKVIKNRTFTFSGQFKAKNYRFSGSDLLFNYEKYSLSFIKIDSITFTPQTIYAKGGRKEIGGHIKFLKPGTLFLNRPDNKSGKVYLPQYPRLKIDEGVIVYFDEATRGLRKYSQDVRFDVPKIDFDSLAVKDIAFDGTFYSGDIFKPFKEVLRIMPDTTLGFLHKVPHGKYTIFGNETSVNFSSELAMNSDGLHSEGNINHLAATMTAKEILFMEDSLTASGQLGKINESLLKGSYFPQVAINDYILKWMPKVDSMIVSSKAGFNFYTGTSSLKGKLVVRTGGLFGIGKLIRTDSETASEQFKFNKEGFTADRSQFNVKSMQTTAKLVLLGKNVNVNFNVNNSIVNIATNQGNFNDSTGSTLEFPYAAYKTNIDRAEWNIKNKKISMKSNVETSMFTSMNASQEGLAFNGNSAIYDIDQMTLNIGGVPFIKSADAKILPDKGQVAIRRDANMLPFKNARLIIDTLNGYHHLINGNIQIVSKNKFTGDATYQFVNVKKDTFNIKMDDFELQDIADVEGRRNKNLSTVARATVIEHDSIFLSPKMLYKGDVTMLAPIKNLSLDGFIIPELKKYPKLGGYWITYKGNKSEEIRITVDKNLKSENLPIFAGLHFRTTTSSNGLYPTFLSAKDAPEDQNVFLASGICRRNEPNKLFSIIPEEGRTLASNKYELLDEKGIINLEGRFDLLGEKISQYVQTSGFAKIRLDTPNHEFNTMMLMNFPMVPTLLTNMAEKIVKTNLDLGINEAAIELNSPELLSKIAHFVGDKDIEEYKSKSAREYVPLFKFSPKFVNTIVFSDLKLVWSPKYNSYRSVGKLGISNIGATDINAKVNGLVEIRKNSIMGDEMYVFLELSPENWYYMGYKDGQMGLISSDDNFNALITAKADKKKVKDYQVIPVDFAEALVYRKNFLEVYRGIKEKPKAPGQKPADAKKLVEVPKDATQKKDEKKKKAEDEKDGF
jgi:hypothetical protein